MNEDAQRETIEFLKELGSRAGDPSPAMSTHISRIFFAGDTVYKLKRAVRTAYLDFSTPDKRLAACEQELALNRRTAPSLYRAVRRIRKAANGLSFDGEGEIVDAVVEMQRFDQACLFDGLAQRGALTARHIESLAGKIAALHRTASVSLQQGGAKAIGLILETNDSELRRSFLASERDLSSVCDKMRAALSTKSALIDARSSAGKVRRCHGDLTLRNIALIEGEPTPFDCLEFDETLSTIDVLYDLAFVLMDLWRKSRADLANMLLNRYLDEVDETDGLTLLPLFIAIRAIIRAHVAARMSDDAQGEKRMELREEAHAYVSLAEDAMRAGAALLVGVGGLSGSGKSTLAAALAPLIAPIPGARVLSSDRIRKALFGVAPTSRLPASAYTSDVSEQVYAIARERSRLCLEAGWPVICDAVFDRAADRAALGRIAAECNAPFHGFWLEASGDVLAARVAARTGDPSDATVDVLQAQQKKLSASGESLDWIRLDASSPASESAKRVRDKFLD